MGLERGSKSLCSGRILRKSQSHTSACVWCVCVLHSRECSCRRIVAQKLEIACLLGQLVGCPSVLPRTDSVSATAVQSDCFDGGCLLVVVIVVGGCLMEEGQWQEVGEEEEEKATAGIPWKPSICLWALALCNRSLRLASPCLPLCVFLLICCSTLVCVAFIPGETWGRGPASIRHATPMCSSRSRDWSLRSRS